VRNVIVLAAGEEAAVEPNESRIGRERNRRVEIWLK
jgi:phosphate transport system substrate-binding protein